MKRRISQKEFERKLRIWAIIVPLIGSIIGSFTSITVAYISSNQVRQSNAKSLDSLNILLQKLTREQDSTITRLDNFKINKSWHSDSVNGDIAYHEYVHDEKYVLERDALNKQIDNFESQPPLQSLISNSFILTVVFIALGFLLLYYIWNLLSRHIITNKYSVSGGNLTTRSS